MFVILNTAEDRKVNCLQQQMLEHNFTNLALNFSEDLLQAGRDVCLYLIYKSTCPSVHYLWLTRLMRASFLPPIQVGHNFHSSVIEKLTVYRTLLLPRVRLLCRQREAEAQQLQHTLEGVCRIWLQLKIIWEKAFWGTALLMASVSTVGLYLIFMRAGGRVAAVDISGVKMCGSASPHLYSKVNTLFQTDSRVTHNNAHHYSQKCSLQLVSHSSPGQLG